MRDFPGLDVRAWGIKDRVPAARRPLAVAHLDLPGGVAVLPFVGLGLDLEAAVRDYKHATRFRGPETPGAAVEAVIQIEEPRPAVYGRALDEAGAPLAAVALGIDFGDLGYVSGMTELDGSFVLPIPEGAWERARRRSGSTRASYDEARSTRSRPSRRRASSQSVTCASPRHGSWPRGSLSTQRGAHSPASTSRSSSVARTGAGVPLTSDFWPPRTSRGVSRFRRASLP